MTPEQAIRQPFGITIFGSSVIRVEPDIASVQFAVTRIDKQPKNAFKSTRDIAQKVNEFLQNSKYKKETNASRLTLSQEWQHVGGTQTFVGYRAQAGFHVLLYDLDRLESLLVGIVDIGVDLISNVSFQTSRLQEFRMDARRRAIDSAKAKAANYCLAANVELGSVIHIEDVDPNVAQDRMHGYQVIRQMMEPDETEDIQAFNPGSIVVGAAVIVSYRFAN
jgi:uncharacterized protein YggE